ncbi:hypothetical protein [Peribacillus kribbensis]|uniref:hypothetical protein n=1 Tax=Peribacillus kribbensis TaxID=356658 RepID=UPI00047C686D|nr:hypothetical protein [Peribacillus kribbensis]
MSLNALITSTLKPIGIPVSFMKYLGSATSYITFFEYNQMGTKFADNEEVQTKHSIQVDCWSDSNQEQTVNKVKSLMKQAGFSRTYETDLYEDNTNTYHKVIRFSYSSTPE